MKKTLVMVLLTLTGLTGCGDQKITQHVTIDKSLLDALQGKAAANQTGTVNPQPSAATSPNPAPAPSSGASATVSADTKALQQIIQENADALNSQNLSAYTSTLHPQSPFFQAMPNLFISLTQIQLQYRVHSSQLISESNGTATVMVQRTSTSNVGFSNDNVLYTLRQSGSALKVYYMEVDESGGNFSDDF